MTNPTDNSAYKEAQARYTLAHAIADALNARYKEGYTAGRESREGEIARLRSALEQVDYAVAHLHDDRFTVQSIRLGIKQALQESGQ